MKKDYIYTALIGAVYALCANLLIWLIGVLEFNTKTDGTLLLLFAWCIVAIASPIYFFAKNAAKYPWLYHLTAIATEVVCAALGYVLGRSFSGPWDFDDLAYVLIEFALPIAFFCWLGLDLAIFVIGKIKKSVKKLD